MIKVSSGMIALAKLKTNPNRGITANKVLKVKASA
jgi:hypothetical protein